jgi:hypothetical protein
MRHDQSLRPMAFKDSIVPLLSLMVSERFSLFLRKVEKATQQQEDRKRETNEG